MSIGGARSRPPQLALAAGGQQFQLHLLAPKIIPLQGEVGGFELIDDEFLEQARVDRAAAALAAFIDAAPPDDQLVYAALLAQAQDASDAHWPA